MQGGGATIDLYEVDAQLKKARAEAGGATATTMNFIVFVEGKTLETRAGERARTLSQKYPARVIMLHTDHEAVKVSTSAKKIGEAATINTEFIELGIERMTPQAIASAVNTLRVAGTPNILFWISKAIADAPLFEHLIGMMDTVIVDSSGIDQDDSALRQLCEFYRSGPRLRICDLAYLRLGPWQDMIAHFFDDQRFLADLHRINRVEITSGSLAEAYYLVGWLASRLQWDACGDLVLCAPNGQHINVILKHDGEPRRVLRFALVTDDSSFCAELTESPDTVCLSVTGAKSSPQRCSPLQHIDNMSLIEKSFIVSARDEVYEQSVHVLDTLLQF